MGSQPFPLYPVEREGLGSHKDILTPISGSQGQTIRVDYPSVIKA